MEENLEGVDKSNVTIKTECIKQEDIDDSKHCIGLGEFVEWKEEALELVDYGDNFEETEINALDDCGVGDTGERHIRESEVKDKSLGSSNIYVGTGLSDCDEFDEEADLEDNRISVGCKRKRGPSESESSDDGDASSEEDDGGEEKSEKHAPLWVDDFTSKRSFEFESENKLLVSVPEQNRPIDWFYLLFDEKLLNRMVVATNEWVEKLSYDPSTPLNTRTQSSLSISELKVFLGLLYHMGTIKMTRLQNYWRTEEMFDLRFVRSRMTRVRFFHIIKCLRFSPRQCDDHGQIEDMIEWFNETMERVYYPDKELVLDEGVAVWKGRKLFSNEYRRGSFKLYSLSEPTGPVLRFTVRSKRENKTSVSGVPKELMAGKGSGHSVLVNSDRLGFAMAKEFLEMNTHCTGFLRPVCKDIPADLKMAKLNTGKTSIRYAEGVMIGKWKYKRPDIYYLSTEYENTMSLATKGANRTLVPLPVLKLRYKGNARVGEVTDPLVDFYPVFNQKCLPWSKKFFVHLLQVVMFNAFKLYSLSNLTNGKRDCLDIHEFRIHVIREMMTMNAEGGRRRRTYKKSVFLPTRPAEKMHVLTKMPLVGPTNRTVRRRCKQCFSDGLKERKTIFFCAQCPGEPGLCPTACFDKYHDSIAASVEKS